MMSSPADITALFVHPSSGWTSQPRWLALSTTLIVLLGVPTVRWILGTLRPRNYPPGPPIIPGLGNLLQIPLVKPYLRFQQWSREFRPSKTLGRAVRNDVDNDGEDDDDPSAEMIGLKVGPANLVVLASARVVHELLDKRGNIYSDRPPTYIVDHHILYEPEERGRFIMGYTEPMRRWRRSFQHILSGRNIKKLLPLLEAEASELCFELLKAEESMAESKIGSNGLTPFENLARNWAMAVPLVMTSGQRLKDMPQSWIDEFFHGQDAVIKMILPGSAPPVDLITPLRYVPEMFAKWKTDAREARKLFLRDAYGLLAAGRDTLHRTIESRTKTYAGMECLIAKALREREEDEKRPENQRELNRNLETDQYVAFQNFGLLGAAVDTALATVSTLMLVFASKADVLAKARKEVDRVAGRSPPRAEQIGEYVYLKACLSEALRWRPPTPGALPHVLSQDDQFEDYFFSKGTTFIIDAWTIGHDATIYEEPNEFIPERYLANPLGVKPEVFAAQEQAGGHRRSVYAFGAGRRQCPGEQFTLTNVPLALAKLLWAFDVEAPTGRIDLSIETGFHDGVVTRPENVNVMLKVRNEERRSLVVEDHERTQAIIGELLG